MFVEVEDTGSRDFERQLANEQRLRGWLYRLDKLERTAKLPGRQDGPVGMVGLAVARRLAEQCDDGKQVRMPLDQLAESLRRSRTAVGKAVRRLAETGFLKYEPGARGRPSIFTPLNPPR